MPKQWWTEEETHYLEEKWGVYSLRTIAKNLGRSLQAIKLKARRLGLADPLLHFADGMTLSQLAKATDISYSVWKNWRNLYEFPAKQKIFVKRKKVWIVRYEDFWKWAELNKQMIDFNKIEPLILGPEPSWVEEKRAADNLKKRKVKKSHNIPWTEEEDNILKGMLNAHCYTYPEIANKLKRSENAIKRRIWQLGLKARPVRLKNVKYTEEEIKILKDMYEKGYCLETIAEKLNKSALGIRGKLERMGYSFKNKVPVNS